MPFVQWPFRHIASTFERLSQKSQFSPSQQTADYLNYPVLTNVRLKRPWESYYCIKCLWYSQNRRLGSECKEGRAQITVVFWDTPVSCLKTSILFLCTGNSCVYHLCVVQNRRKCQLCGETIGTISNVSNVSLEDVFPRFLRCVLPIRGIFACFSADNGFFLAQRVSLWPLCGMFFDSTLHPCGRLYPSR